VPKHMLSARQVQVAREGDTHDGEGLILRVQLYAPGHLPGRDESPELASRKIHILDDIDIYPLGMHYVYLLISASSRRRYVGLTANLKQRLTEHNSGKLPHTAQFALAPRYPCRLFRRTRSSRLRALSEIRFRPRLRESTSVVGPTSVQPIGAASRQPALA